MEVEIDAGIEAPLCQASNYCRAKAAAARFCDRRPALLAPAHAKCGIAGLGAFEAPFDCHLTRAVHKRTILSRVGGELVYSHAYGLARS